MDSASTSWIDDTILSSDGVTEYKVTACWNPNDERWEAVICRCRGFTQWGKCKHLAELEEKHKDTPGPPVVIDAELKSVNGQLRCSVCHGYEFIVFKRTSKDLTWLVNVEFVCTKCGRLYAM